MSSDTDELRALAENELKLNDAESLLLLQLCDELDALRGRTQRVLTVADNYRDSPMMPAAELRRALDGTS